MCDIQARVSALLAQMTPQEKLAQMTMCSSADLFDSGRLNAARALERFQTAGIGALLFPRRPDHSAAQARNEVRQLQEFFRRTMRIPIPPFVVEEGLHGLMFPGATVFPQSIAMASTWNERLVGQMAGVIAREAHAVGVSQVLCPDLDLCREPRWGRVEETFGEDACLTARLGTAYVQTLQAPDPQGRRIAATLKHFAAHGTPEGGLNLAPVLTGERLLQEYYLAPFRRVIRDAAPLSVMPAYSELDGIPCSSSRRLLTDILRGELGFDGYTISDFGAMEMLISFHRTAGDRLEAGIQALHAGMDMEAPIPYCFDSDFLKAVREGAVPMEEVNQAVRRILTAKFRTGLLEQPEEELPDLSDVLGHPAHRQLAYEAAAESMVLLENRNGILPFGGELQSLAVIGPNADTWQLGDYTIDRPCKTPLQAIRERAGAGISVEYAPGCGIYDTETSGIAQAAALAAACDAVILCVGGSSTIDYGIGWGQDTGKVKTCGEGFDVSDLGLPGIQQQLAKAVLSTGTPVIVVHIDGRPAAVSWITERCAAWIEMWYAGQEGADALAATLFGDVNPSGRLPLSIPASTGQSPAYYNYKPSGRGYYRQPGAPGHPGRDYVFASPAPLYPFGYGLSYTTFAYSGLHAEYDAARQGIRVQVRVSNTGPVAGKEVTAVFVRTEASGITRPVRELKAFCKHLLQPGEEVLLELFVPQTDLLYQNEAHEWVPVSGRIRLFVADWETEVWLDK